MICKDGMNREQSDFEAFKSNICHMVKSQSRLDFLIDTIEADDIGNLWAKKQYAEAMYLLAMIDYLSRLEEIPLCNRYDTLRTCALESRFIREMCAWRISSFPVPVRKQGVRRKQSRSFYGTISWRHPLMRLFEGYC